MQNGLKREPIPKGKTNSKTIARIQVRHENQDGGQEQWCEHTVGRSLVEVTLKIKLKKMW